MSYRLINANNITFNSDGFITAENIEKMPCIYADLPNGMDGEHYVLEQEPILDKIRAEIKAMFPPSGSWMYEEGHEMDHTVCEVLADVLQIIDKYKAESEDKE